jgi:hypothetical protein
LALINPILLRIECRTKSPNGMVRAVAPAPPASNLARGSKAKEHAMSQNLNSAVAVIGIDIGKNSFHVVGLDDSGVLSGKWLRQ